MKFLPVFIVEPLGTANIEKKYDRDDQPDHCRQNKLVESHKSNSTSFGHPLMQADDTGTHEQHSEKN